MIDEQCQEWKTGNKCCTGGRCCDEAVESVSDDNNYIIDTEHDDNDGTVITEKELFTEIPKQGKDISGSGVTHLISDNCYNQTPNSNYFQRNLLFMNRFLIITQ